MSNEAAPEQGKRSRSPSFPYIGLQKAIERIQVINTKARRNEVRVADIAKDWGLKPKSSSLDRNVAALLAYGLVEDVGSGEGRKIKLSESGHRILEDRRPGIREDLLAKAALRPKVIADYAQLWSEGRPDDKHSVSHLMFDGGFTDEGARIFLRVFDETMRFAGDMTTAKVVDSDTPTGEGLEPIVNTAAQTLSPPTLAKPFGDTAVTPPLAGKRQAVFTLDEGDVSLTFPADLSVEGYQELKAYLDIFLRKAQRQKAQEGAGGSSFSDKELGDDG